MNNDFRLFRHKVTGKTDYFPAQFADWPDFEEVDPATDSCVDCVVQIEDEAPEPQPEIVPLKITTREKAK